MIVKVIPKRADVADDYWHLAEYIAAAKEKGEKLDRLWIVNCDAGTELEDLEMALIEIQAKRDLKPKIANKTYHLVVSFRAGEREKLTDDDLKEIEGSFAEALGYDEHQRVVGTHTNTDHFHMHVAYSKIHPQSLRCHTPRKDFYALHRVCREMERTFGLYVDNGIEVGEGGQQELSAKARNLEAQTWQYSFERHLKEHKAEILAAVSAAGTWPEVHGAFAEFDAGLKKRGAGLVIFHLENSRHSVKASSLDRSCSLKPLEARLGEFQSAPAVEKDAGKVRTKRPNSSTGKPPSKPPRFRYVPRPLFKHPGQDQLWRMYQSGRRAPGFLARNLHLRNWKYYLLADAHKDAMAMAMVIFYRELFRSIEGAPAPSHAPKELRPVLNAWFVSLPWAAAGAGITRPVNLDGVGLKVDGGGRVVFPMRDGEGRVWAVRALDREGRFCDIGDMGAHAPLSHVVDPDRRLAVLPGPYNGPVVLTADCAAGTQLHKQTGAPTVLAGREKDLSALATRVRAEAPKAVIVIAARDKSRSAERAAKKATARLMTIQRVLALSADIADQVKQSMRPLTANHERSAGLISPRRQTGPAAVALPLHL